MPPLPGPSDDEIREFLDSQTGSLLEERVKEISNTVREEELKKIKEAIDRQNLHDELVRYCISAFIPGTLCNLQTGYGFVTVEPLKEMNVKNFDLLILNEEQSTGIFVECKTGSSNWSREVEDTYESIKQVEENLSYLEKQIKNKIAHREFVICVPSEHQVALAGEIERRENAGIVKASTDPLFRLWGLHYFGDTKLQLFTRINSNRKDLDKHHLDKRLSSLLAEGVAVSSEVWTPVFPSSHPTKIFSNLVAWILRESARKSQDFSVFPSKAPKDYFDDSANLPHYARELIGKDLSDRFVRECVALGLLQSDNQDPDSLRFTSKGKTIKTILSNFQKGHLDGMVERNTRKRAEWQAAREFLESQSTLKRFE
jgi:hypothetical protein